MVPAVYIVGTSGNLGSQSPSGQPPVVVMGPGTKGTTNLPTSLSRPKAVLDAFGYGPAPDVSAFLTARGLRVMHVRTESSTAGTVGTIDVTGVTGTAVITVDADPAAAPNDDYDVWGRAVAGGTIGTAGITYQLSADGGNNWGPVTALGTATSINAGTALNVGVLEFLLGAGTLAKGDYWKLRCNAPQATATDLGAALGILQLNNIYWEEIVACTPIANDIQATLDASMVALRAKGRFCWWCCPTRLPSATETDATYQAALATELASIATDFGCVPGADTQLVSSIPGREYNYRKSPLATLAYKLGSVSSAIDIAQLDAPGGALPGVAIRDGNGNIIHHDENDQPGLDDLRLTVLRTVPGETGVFCNNPRIRSASGSDFEFVQHRRVMNDFERALWRYFMHRLSKPVLVDKRTGFVRESAAQEIEAGARAVCAAAMAGKASDFSVVVSRTDNLLSTKTMTVDASVVPLAYPKIINITSGFRNPALILLAA